MVHPLRSERSLYHPISVIARLIVDTGSKDPVRLEAAYLDKLQINRKDRTEAGLMVKEGLQAGFLASYPFALTEVEGASPASKKGRDTGFAPKVAPKKRGTVAFIASQKGLTPEEREQERQRAERQWRERIYAYVPLEGGRSVGEMKAQELIDLPDAVHTKMLPYRRAGEQLRDKHGFKVTLRESGIVPDIG